MDLSQADARRLFDYSDGQLLWKSRPREDFANDVSWRAWNDRYPGRAAGSSDSRGYVSFGMRGRDGKLRRYLVHRVIWSWHNGPADDEVDHRDHSPSNNKIGNLREATPSQNKANRRQLKAGTCHYVGVSYEADRRRWKVGIRKSSGKTSTIGRFKCPTVAAIAYDRVAKAEFGEFAMLNFPAQAKQGMTG